MSDPSKKPPTAYEESLMRAMNLDTVEQLDELLARPISKEAALQSGSPDEEYELADRMYEEEDRGRENQERLSAPKERENPKETMPPPAKMRTLTPDSAPRQVAEYLYMWTFFSEDLPDHAERLHSEIPAHLGIDFESFYREYIHFRAFVTDWVLDSAERGDGRTRKVREDFNLLITLMIRSQANPRKFGEAVNAHMRAYEAAANTKHHLGVSWAAATIFCELCGDRNPAKEVSAVIVMSVEFAHLINIVNNALRLTRLAQ